MEHTEKKQVTVRVAGKKYTFISDDTQEYVQRVAELAERKLTETAAVTHQSPNAAAVLACISLTDELLRSQKENSILRQRIQRMNKNENGSTGTGR